MRVGLDIMTGTEVPEPRESGKAHLQLLSLQCRDSPESHNAKLSVVTLHQADAPLLMNQQNNCTINIYGHIPGFYAESHLRVQKSCS